MTVNSIPGINNLQTSQSLSNASSKVQAAIASILSGANSSADVADVSVASQLQSQTSSLKQVSSNLTQALSLTEVAGGGVGQITTALNQLQTLVLQAQSPTLNADNRKQIGLQIKQLSAQINQIASGTSFNGQDLLNGSVSGANSLSLAVLLSGTSDNSNDLSIPNLSSDALFGGQGLDVSTPDAATQAASLVGDALSQIGDTQASIASFQQLIDYASASVDSALTNQQAAQSTISEADFAAANSNDALATLQQNAAIALAAQGNRLSPTLLQLVG